MRGCDDRHGASNNRSIYFWTPYDQSIPDREKIVNTYYCYYYYFRWNYCRIFYSSSAGSEEVLLRLCKSYSASCFYIEDVSYK